MRTLAATSVAILLAGLFAIPAVAQDVAEVAPAEQEVTAAEVSEEVDIEAPPVAAATDEAEVADEAVEEAVDEATEAQEATEEAVAAEEAVDDADGGYNWTLILGLVAAFVIVWFLLRRRKARRTA